MTTAPTTAEIRSRFRELHAANELFVLPNPWDIGSAKILVQLGFVALATTSSGHAASLGKHDQQVSRDELVDHVAAIATAVPVPLTVDAERCFAETLGGVADTVGLLADAGAAGLSIEDYDPTAGGFDPVGKAAERVAAAAEVAHAHGMVLTARAEARLYGAADLDDVIARLVAYRDAGADAVYAPGLSDLAEIARVVTEVGVPVNVLALPKGPSVADLAATGVRRVSTGGALAWAAYGALERAATELLGPGTSSYTTGALSRPTRHAFD